MLLDLINFEKIKRVILHLAVILVVLGLQNLLFSRISPLGVRPLFVPAVVVAIGLFEGGAWGASLGLVTGFLCGLRFHGSVLPFTVLFAAFGFLSGMLSLFFVNKRFFSYAVICAVAFALTAFCQMFRLLFFYGAAPGPLLYTGLLQTLWSLPFTFLIYFPVKAIARRRV